MATATTQPTTPAADFARPASRARREGLIRLSLTAATLVGVVVVAESVFLPYRPGRSPVSITNVPPGYGVCVWPRRNRLTSPTWRRLTGRGSASPHSRMLYLPTGSRSKDSMCAELTKMLR